MNVYIFTYIELQKWKAFIISEEIIFKWYLIITTALRNDSIKQNQKKRKIGRYY